VLYGQFHDYPMFGGITMTDHEEQSLKETKRKEERAAEEIEQLDKDKARRKDSLAREQAIEDDQKKRGIKRAEKQATEDIKQSARDKARRKDTLAREQAIEKDQEARKLKSKKQSRE
jgi:hypothetical protein